MAANKSVVVLTPNGRRQTVKVTPNTTILQIIEEVCKKQGFKAEEYDIKHHNKILDTSAIIRFSGLPNNAQLELSTATRTRSEGAVTVGLQLENGTRLMGDFLPNSSLWEILLQLCPEESNPKNNPVIIYMRREVYGVHSLQNTTLRALGLTGGRAMLRLIHKTPEELHTQANISASLPLRPVEEKPYVRTLKKSDSPPESPAPASSEQFQNKQPEPRATTPEKQDNFLTQYMKQEKRKHDGAVRKSSIKKPERSPEPMETDVASDVTKTLSYEPTKQRALKHADEEFVFLGDRNALLFSLETAQAIPAEDLPDDFFELTIDDAKKLLRDLKQQRMQLEDSQLLTSRLRNFEETKKQLGQISKFKKCIIRVQFPDRTVLQGSFKPVETVQTIQEFVRNFLAHKNLDFYLYTTPPKVILNSDSRLLELGFVPNALVHFGTASNQEEQYLKKEYLKKFTTSSMASLAAAKLRQQSTRPVESLVDVNEVLDDENLFPSNDVNVGASTSAGTTSSYEDYDPRPLKTPEKLPKWFKPSK